MRMIPIIHSFSQEQDGGTLSKSQVEAIERFHLARLEKERVAKERAQERIEKLSASMKAIQEENRKLKFFNDSMVNTLFFIARYKGKENEQQNG